MERIIEKHSVPAPAHPGALESITKEEAIRLMTGLTCAIRDSETTALDRCLGRILARDITAGFDNPPFHRSAIDGYACHWEDTVPASPDTPVSLHVLEEIDAGHYSHINVGRGEAVRIMTGAPIPRGCDCCVRQEDTDYGGTDVTIRRSVKCWENYCFKGEDFKKGTLMIPAGRKLGYVETGILASLGLNRIPVIRMPRVALVTTGDEVILPGDILPEGKIYNSNLFLLNARLMELGIPPVHTGTVPDKPEELAGVLEGLSAHTDLIITTGGVSVGNKDIVRTSLGMAGAGEIFWRIRLKPGSPTVFSILNQVPVVSLSGNPFGALANFELLIRPMLSRMTGDPSLTARRTQAVMDSPFPKASNSRRFVRGHYEDGHIRLPQGLHSSGVLSSMYGCNCMADIPAGTPGLNTGDVVDVVLL